jgi:enoyl-CoA hydratase/carnithine racemase
MTGESAGTGAGSPVNLRTSPDAPGVLWVSMDLPPVNALGPRLRQGLIEAAARAGDETVRVVVLAGAGRCFSAGGDVTELEGLRDEATARAVHAEYLTLYREWRAIPVPTIAAIASYALGGALELALCCDLRYAEAGSFLSASGVGMGLLESAHSLPVAVPGSFAAEMLYTARRVDAEEAAARGLLTRVTDRLDEDVATVAAQIARHPRAALRATKATIAVARAAGEQAAGAHAIEEWRMLRGSPDHAAAVAASRARRGRAERNARPSAAQRPVADA